MPWGIGLAWGGALSSKLQSTLGLQLSTFELGVIDAICAARALCILLNQPAPVALELEALIQLANCARAAAADRVERVNMPLVT